MAELSETAVRFLRTLRRVPFLTTARVESELIRSGKPCFSAWLDFHERFAGYVEPLGPDEAIWGIMHEQPQWLSPFEAQVEPEKDGVTFYISCADVHPSYSYQLTNTGEFLGFPAESFAVHVERCAAGWDFGSRHATQALTQAELRDPEFIERCTNAEVLTHASDRFSRYLRDADTLVVWRAGAKSPQRGWRRI